LSWRDLESLGCSEWVVLVVNLHREFAFEDEEELPGLLVEMTLFFRAGGHPFFDDAQVSRLDQMPAVAIGTVGATPFVVLGGFSACD